MATALIHLDPEQKARLTRRARRRRRSFSQEVRNAIDLYLDLPVETEDELAALAREAKQSAGRSIARLDETIACLQRTLRNMSKTR